ncbi:MBL fold metallo-hydrolase [Chitinophagaceae bacterium IBVUCB1]|nr:MBL fold metallo-hydrolase [Chitinophagaceae bacterium IBVUCB1]
MKALKRLAYIVVTIVFIITSVTILYMQKATFGKTPAGARLERIKQSPNYRDGKFQNLSHTPDLAEGVSYYRVMKDFLFDKDKRNTPADVIPSQKTDLHTLPIDSNVLVWFGHSSYYIQLDGKRILVDPVFSGSASPLRFTTKSFKGSDAYTVDDFPHIDYLFITHDHYDHLDYETIMQLKPKLGKIIMGLGVGAHFEHWGFNADKLIERDWNETIVLDDSFTIHTTPARHFSGRGFKRNQSLWMSYVLQSPSMKLFLGGDSGYDTHFKTIGDTFGPFDLAILECGQYNAYWKYIHMMPEQTAQAAIDLHAGRLMPVHWSKFSLSLHAWDEPINRVTTAATAKDLPIVTTMIGQPINLNDMSSGNTWWLGVK